MKGLLPGIDRVGRSLANGVAFGLRRRLRWSRGTTRPSDEDKGLLFRHLDGGERVRAIARERTLRERYDLEPLRSASTRSVYRENLYLLDWLDRAVRPHLPALVTRSNGLRALDVGSRNWSYVFALERFLRRATTAGGLPVLDGIEIDGHGVYPDLHARIDHARGYAAQTGNPAVRYHVDDFLSFPAQPCQVLFCLFPFLTEHALLRWGLPPSLLAPEQLLERITQVLEPGGLLVALQQTGVERDCWRGLLEQKGLELAAGGAVDPLLLGDPAAADRHFSLTVMPDRA